VSNAQLAYDHRDEVHADIKEHHILYAPKKKKKNEEGTGQQPELSKMS